MDPDEILQILKAAEGNPSLIARAMVDITFPERPESDRARLKQALEAASIPHWFDGPILAAILGITLEEAHTLATDLSLLSVVEPFTARGNAAQNVHEKSRLALRGHLFKHDHGRFREWSLAAARIFEGDEAPAKKIEWIYQQLSGGADQAAETLAALNLSYSYGRPERWTALAAAMRELEESSVLNGSARAMALCCTGFAVLSRSRVNAVEGSINLILELAREADSPPVLANALILHGDIFNERGNLTKALELFQQGQSIIEEFSQAHPRNPDWQLTLSLASSRVGKALQERGELVKALSTCRRALEISKALTACDSDNTAWQRSLAISLSRVGDVFKLQGEPDEALAAFHHALEIYRALGDLDPDNAAWQRELAAAYTKIGDIFKQQDEPDEALVAFRHALEIFRALAALDPDNASWQRDLAAAHSRIGGIFQTQRKVPEALTTFELSLEISERLFNLDPLNAGWKRDLSVARLNHAQLLSILGRWQKALRLVKGAIVLLEELVALDPSMVNWTRDLAYARKLKLDIALRRRR